MEIPRIVMLHSYSLTLRRAEQQIRTRSFFQGLTVGASDPAGTEICEFHGKSAIGCLPDGADLTLVRPPGGRLGTLLIVIGKGKVHRSN